ncbi:MAG: DUF3800 domain-containing protein [bacterium]
MRTEYNIYCDESCHLENDKQKAMVLGAIWCPKTNTQNIFKDIRSIKTKHGLPTRFEIKWNKVYPAKIDFFEDLIKYFFNNEDLHFRVIVIPDKSKLNHEDFDQTHDDFYYKMYFNLLKVILDPESSYYIFLDIKDTRSQKKINILKDILRNNHYDYSKEIIKGIQHIRSHEVELLQLTDLLIGAFSYLHRGLNGSSAKLKLIEQIKEYSGYSMVKSTLFLENKFNIFIWDTSLKTSRRQNV